jgi:O-antigen ligase
MPRADIADREAWLKQLRAGQQARTDQIERLTRIWSSFILACTVLYVMIGHSPYSRGMAIDAATGAVEISPVNRYIWILLAMMAAPILYVRRRMLLDAARRLWPLLLLFAWFALTTRWALDPGTSGRRLFLYIITLEISVALAVGFDSAKRFHRALAVTCAIMIGIDLASWAAMPGLSMTDLGLAAIHNHKNTLGAVMLFACIILGPYIFAQRTARGRWFWGLMFAGAFLLLVASKSKTSLAIFLAIAAATPLLLGALRLSGKTVAAICMTLLLVLFGALLMWLAYCTSTGRNPLAPLYGLTFTKRTDVWAFVLGEIFKRPFAGAGFASFWDINPALQPSLQSGLWFAQMDAFTNEAHNGYLDLLVTTGVTGLFGALAVLVRWALRGLGMIREMLRSPDPEDRWNVPYITALGLFPAIIFAHNWMESSYFTANSLYGTLILLVGVTLDVRYGRRDISEPAISARAARPIITANRTAMTTASRA